ncbi:DUF2239 family protein [Novosphingobium sp. YJ-S2-02]|uniref:DUF2239 family protein n=1 Tax=Novosphingobium aureum TaxID=2792964 RepID=A0A931HAJ8_9SPHN|nr:DUF2239 family protein [Novosphingobium aureum]MBH0112425.1 DUF2239 family protein [Novosphingobium aureum]
MTKPATIQCTAFRTGQKIASGSPAQLVRQLHADPAGVLVFDDATGKVIDLDWRQVYETQDKVDEARPAPRKRGRPRLGVTPREVTLLPRHWDWLAAQPGGASQALRRLVDQARRNDAGRTAQRLAAERCYRAMSALAGDLPGFEEASRQLFSTSPEKFREAIPAWPDDVRDYILLLLLPRDEDIA